MQANQKSFLIILMSISFLYPVTISRIVTTIDFPNYFTHSYVDVDDKTNEVKTKHDTSYSLDFGYEQRIVNSGDFHMFAGGEFMLGRMSSLNVSFHSIYLKPSLSLSEKFLAFLKIGFCVLNKEDKSFILDKGSLLSAGFEYMINEKISLGLSHSTYNLFDQVRRNPDIETNWIDPITQEPLIIPGIDTENDLQYNKVGFSIIYGFESSK